MSQSPKLSKYPPDLRIAIARAAAADAMPYFESGIRSLVPCAEPGSNRIGVDRQAVLHYDPEVLGQWTVKEAGAVVLHEFMHIFQRYFDRLDRMTQSGAVSGAADAQTFNIAADAEINDNLAEAGLPLPKVPIIKEGKVVGHGDPIYPSTYGMPDHKLAEEYYPLIKERQPQGGQQPDGGWGADADASGAPGQQDAGDLPSGRDEADIDAIVKGAAEQVQQHAAEGRGNIPSGILRTANAEVRPSRVRWQEQLGHAVRGEVAAARGASDYSYSIRNRRQAGLDAVMDPAPILPGFEDRNPSVWLGIDTSWSMGDEHMQRAVGEAEAIMRATSSSMTVMACDAEVHSFVKVRRARDIFPHIKGGGGTDFRPMFDRLEQAKDKPDVFVVYTDGYGCYPEQAPKGVRVIWLSVGQISVKWGKVIQVELSEGY